MQDDAFAPAKKMLKERVLPHSIESGEWCDDQRFIAGVLLHHIVGGPQGGERLAGVVVTQTMRQIVLVLGHVQIVIDILSNICDMGNGV